MNYGVVLKGVNEVTAQELPEVGEPDFDEVKLQTLFCGLCGSDLDLLKHGEIAGYELQGDLIIGHEAVARVLQVGPNVLSLSAGDLVTCEPALSCMGCLSCLSGKSNLCGAAFDRLCGMPNTNGFMCHQFIHPSMFCLKLPATFSSYPLRASLCEPLAVVINSVKRSKLQPGMDVLIIGAGTIGLLTLLVARHWGARDVIVVDLHSHRLAIAQQLGASNTFLADPSVPDYLIHLEFKIKISTHDAVGVDRTFECTGTQDASKLAIGCTTNGGKMIATGLASSEIHFPLARASSREIDIIGVCRYKIDSFPMAISLLEQLNVDPILKNVYSYRDIREAFDALEKGEGVKITIDMTRSDDEHHIASPLHTETCIPPPDESEQADDIESVTPESVQM